MFPMHPPEFFQVRDDEGKLHLVNRWSIARVELQGVDEYLTRAEEGSYELNETGISPAHLRVEIVCEAAGYVQLSGQEALAFLRRFYRPHHFIP
jgi:hypothetical protein